MGHRTVTWSRITAEEGWEAGIQRALRLHRKTGQTVRVVARVGGQPTPRCEISTVEGNLRITAFKQG